MRERVLFLVFAMLFVAAACAPQDTMVKDDAIASFLEAISSDPAYVGAGLVEDGTAVLVTVHGDPDAIKELATQLLPREIELRIAQVPVGLVELNSLARRIVASELGSPSSAPIVTLVDVDELRGVVVIGVERLDLAIVDELTARYGPLVVVELHPRATLSN